jgi:hypothetical protein
MLHFLDSEKIEKVVFFCFGKVEDARNSVECGTLKERPNFRYGVSGVYGRIRTARETSGRTRIQIQREIKNKK